MNNEQLQDILEQHRQWLSGDGQRANLEGSDLRGSDLEGAKLIDAKLRGSDLEGAKLIDADLRGADLTDAKLRGANLKYANLSGADLIDADLSGADLRGATHTGANLNWQSHDLIAEILRRAAGVDAEKRKVAGLILVSRDWCWEEFLSLNDPMSAWALKELSVWAEGDTNAPEIFRTKSSTTQETTL
jgi:uncharacterized protein YjbI with pentapeptide repeats